MRTAVTGPPVTHLLLDFFGTLVDYSASRTEQGYHATHELVEAMGSHASYADFLDTWVAEFERLEERSVIDGSEFSMGDVARAALTALLPDDPTPGQIDQLIESYLREWNTGVLYRPEIPEVVKNLASRFRLAVVTNTHWESLVPAHLANIGIAGYFDAVVMSVQVGRRKPHPAIYEEALNRLGITAQSAIFAGDTYLADYAGPVAAGMSAFVIDPYGKYDVPADRRLAALRDLPVRLGI